MKAKWTKMTLKQAKGFVSWTAVLLLLPAPLVLALLIEDPGELHGQRLFTIGAGIYAYVWFLLDIYLATRPRWLERRVGLPKMYMIHGIAALSGIILAAIHKYTTHIFGWSEKFGTWSFWAFVALFILAAIFLNDFVASHVRWFNNFKKWLERYVMKHEFSVWIHRINIAAVLLAFLHVVVIPYLWHAYVFMGLFLLQSAVVFVAYLYYLLIKPDTRKKYTVTNVRRLNHDTMALTITPNGVDEMLEYAPGDYVFIAIKQKGLTAEPHPFSIMSAPNETGVMELGIKDLGDFTHQIDKIKLGTPTLVEGPYGELGGAVQTEQPLVLVGGGIGITPMLGLLNHYKDSQQIKVLYSVSKKQDLIATQDLADILRQYSNVEVVQTVTREKITGLAYGRINREFLHQHLTDEEIKNGQVLMVGPGAFMKIVRKSLIQMGMHDEQIHYEKFSF